MLLDDLQAVEAQWAGCRACRLCAERKRVVVGEGPAPAPILIIGEGPGRDEDREGRPFIGEAGRFLWHEADGQGLDLARCYVTNVVACRPPENRVPLADEAEACRPRLEAIARLVQPGLIVAVGGVALTALTGEVTIHKFRGRTLTSVGETGGLGGIPTIPIFHPAGLLPGRLKSADDLEAFRGDLKSVATAIVGVGEIKGS